MEIFKSSLKNVKNKTVIILRKRMKIELIIDDKKLSHDTELARKVMNLLHEALPQDGYEVIGNIKINVEKNVIE